MKYIFHSLTKVLIVLSSGIGVILAIIQADISFNSLTYFTHQSNLLVFIVYSVYIFYNHKYKQSFITILYQAVVAIILTGLVYHVMLRPFLIDTSYEASSLIDILVHTVTPLLVIFERLIFSKKGILQRRQLLWWLTFPLFYYIFTLVYAWFGGVFHQGTEFESKYPYFFLNIQENGIGYFLIVIFLILMIGYIVFIFNRRILVRKRD